jgi:hypothetical protein
LVSHAAAKLALELVGCAPSTRPAKVALEESTIAAVVAMAMNARKGIDMLRASLAWGFSTLDYLNRRFKAI